MNRDIAQVAEILQLKDIFPSKKIACRTEKVSTLSAVATLIAGFGGDGWVCTADKSVRFASYKPAENDPVLSAELAKGDSSLHVRQDGPAWIASTLVEEDSETCFIAIEQHLALDGALLVYHVSWEPVNNAVDINEYHPREYHPRTARLAAVNDRT